jgi:hypothetical protein
MSRLAHMWQQQAGAHVAAAGWRTCGSSRLAHMWQQQEQPGSARHRRHRIRNKAPLTNIQQGSTCPAASPPAPAPTCGGDGQQRHPHRGVRPEGPHSRHALLAVVAAVDAHVAHCRASTAATTLRHACGPASSVVPPQRRLQPVHHIPTAGGHSIRQAQPSHLARGPGGMPGDQQRCACRFTAACCQHMCRAARAWHHNDTCSAMHPVPPMMQQVHEAVAGPPPTCGAQI